ncbi:hypothetical protein [Curtobacterium sp. MCPF17_021]|uniref:hypothetical protein n=1 Tax=Curtobacterium sp. MCPF17_021 TaxID=2175639 RepID=UPI0015E8DDD8|nr:hypothetical protein [Curtobacterium sp. MCPF17_021]WIE82811.1 hypothetical protein DEJ29_015700 [Curtobacterium sp. MCPF17_021]
MTSADAPAPAGQSPSNTTAREIAFRGEDGAVTPTVKKPATPVAPTTSKPEKVDL